MSLNEIDGLPAQSADDWRCVVAFVVTGACIGVKDRACVEVCPVESFYDGKDQLYIHPDVCVDCGLCPIVCPVNAIFADSEVPADQAQFIQKNVSVFTGQHQAGCGCGSCDPATNMAIGLLPVAQPK